MQRMAPPSPREIPAIFIALIFSLKKTTAITNTQIGCKLVKMELETGVVLLNPIR